MVIERTLAVEAATEIAVAAESLARSAADFGVYWRGVSERVERGESATFDTVPRDVVRDINKLTRLIIEVASIQRIANHPAIPTP